MIFFSHIKCQYFCRLIKIHWALILAVLLAVGLSSQIWRMNFPVTDFSDTVISMASARNVDINKAVFFYFLYALPLALLITYLGDRTNISCHALQECKRVISNMINSVDSFDLLIAALLISQLALGANTIYFRFWSGILAFMLVVRKYSPLEKENIMTLWLASLFIFSAPVFYAAFKFHIQWGFFLFAIVSLAIILIANRIDRGFQVLYSLLYDFIYSAMACYIIIYLVEIARIRGFAMHIWPVFIPYVIGVIFVSYVADNKGLGEFNTCPEFNNRLLYGLLAVMSLSAVPVLGGSWYLDFFEGSNHGISISQAIDFGKIPIVETLDAHMLSSTLGGLLYYALTEDYNGAVFAPYSGLISSVISIPSLCFLLRRFFNIKQAFIILVLFPTGMLSILMPGLIALVLFTFWLEKRNKWWEISLWLGFVTICLYRIDLGATFGVALIVAPIFYYLTKKQYKSVLKYLISGGVVLVVAILFGFEISKWRGINFGVLMQSFLTAFSSNQHWGYGRIGTNAYDYVFYFIIPFFIAFAAWPRLKRIHQQNGHIDDWIVLFFYVAFILNIPRMLTRHSLIEHSIAAFGIPLFLLAVSLLNDNQKRNFMFIVVLCLAAFIGNNQYTSFASNLSHTDAVVTALVRGESQFHKMKKEDQEQINLYKKFFDERLSQDETYFDFSDQSLFYAFTGRSNPIYINQSPAMINGRKGQMQALENIRKNKVKFIIFPYHQRRPAGQYFGCYRDIDSILNTDRYYLLTEYIAENYRPYCEVGAFAIWCLKDEYASLQHKDPYAGAKYRKLDYNYDIKGNHNHQIGNIPYLWGQYASSKDEKGIVTPISTSGNAYSIPSQLLGKRGFITFTIRSTKNTSMTVNLGNGKDTFIKYKFNIKKGMYIYRLRISSDILWYSSLITTMFVENKNMEIKEVYFQEVTQ